MRTRVLLVPVAVALVLALDACVGPTVPRQVLTGPVPTVVSTPAPPVGTSWPYRPTSQRLAYIVNRRAQLTIREEGVVSLDSVASHAEVFFSVGSQTNRIAGAVTAFNVRQAGRAPIVPQGVSFPFPFVAAYADSAKQLVFIAPIGSACLAPTVTILNELRDLWFPTPDTLRVGTSWVDSASYTSCRDSVPLRSDVRRTFTASSASEPGGHALLLIRGVSRTIISSDGVLAGEPLNIRGAGTGELEYTIDPVGGELLSAGGSSSLELTVQSKVRTQTVRQVADIRIGRRL